MAKRKINPLFQPFIHDNLDLKNELVQLARWAIDDESVEKRLSAVLIYSNIAEYLVEHLLDSLNHCIYENSYKNFGGILFLSSASWTSYGTIWTLIGELKKFTFPDKEEIIKCLEKIVKARNKIFHNFAKTDIETIGDLLSKDLPTIATETETLITKTNTIYASLQKIIQS